MLLLLCCGIADAALTALASLEDTPAVEDLAIEYGLDAEDEIGYDGGCDGFGFGFAYGLSGRDGAAVAVAATATVLALPFRLHVNVSALLFASPTL